MTYVEFRTFLDGGDVIALFPEEIESGEDMCQSYMHVGQHAPSEYKGCMTITRPSTVDETLTLKLELEQLGYDLTMEPTQ